MTQSYPALSEKGYVAGRLGYLYPALGESKPPGGAKVLILNQGGVCISGTWSDNAGFIAWSPMPLRSDYVRPTDDGELPGSNELLLFTKGGTCVFGPWCNDGRFLGWARKPERNLEKERRIRELAAAVSWKMAA